MDRRSIRSDRSLYASSRACSTVTRSVVALIIAACALATAPAHALTLCANSSQSLQTAFFVAAFAQEAVTIRIATGNYAVPGAAYSMSSPTTLLGGYDAACTQRSAGIKASETVFEFNGASVEFNQIYGAPTSRFVADGLTFLHASELIIDTGSWDDAGSIKLSRMRISGVPGSSHPLLLSAKHGGNIEIDNVLLDKMSSAMPSGECAAHLIFSDGASVSLTSVTADVAPNKNFCLGSKYGETPGGTVSIHNSIIWSSVQTSSIVNIEGADTINMINSTYFGLNRGGANGQTISALQVNPEWVNPGNGDYHLNASSTSVNSATPIVPGGLSPFDIDGNARWQGALPDRGAYESTFQNAQTYSVTTAADSGAGSLRDAMTKANENPNLGVIKFAIPGACPRVIALNTVLPKVTTSMFIDGTSQPGWLANTDDDAFLATLCVVVKPVSGTLVSAFNVPAIAAADTSLTLRGVAMGGFSQPVVLGGGSGHVIAGNRFGGFFGSGIDLVGATLHSINVTSTLVNGSFIIGGPAPADRNLISKSALSGINVQDGVEGLDDHCQIVNNLIGTSPSGNTAAANFTGITMSGNHCLIDANRIVGNTTDGIVLNNTYGVRIQRNIIGLTVNGNGLQNSGVGIRFTTFPDTNVIGAPLSTYAWGLRNTIRFMADAGIVMPAGIQNTIRSNEIRDNGIDGDGLDIDLGPPGPNPNDVDDANSSLANRGQNFPIVSKVVIPAGTPANATNVSATLTLKLDSVPNRTYRIDAYFTNHCSGVNGRGHADTYLGGTTAANLQVVDFIVTLPNVLPSGYVSFTATNPDGDTSEMGTCYPVSGGGDTIFKNSFED